MDGDYGLILGDFNTTMDPDKDRYGYESDNHRKSRYVMRMWEESEELIDTFRFLHPDSLTHTWRTKDNSKHSRLDYVMATPATLPFISDFGHHYHGFEISDHSSTTFSLDFEGAEKGPGIFRAHPSLLKNLNYKKSMSFSIRQVILDGIHDKHNSIYIHNMRLLREQIDI